MKTHPCDLEFIPTTRKELEDAIKYGGWVEIYFIDCPLCDGDEERIPHRHFICPECKAVDFANKDKCFQCWKMADLRRIRLWLYDFYRKHGKEFLRIGISILIFVVFNLANMGVR